MATTGIIVLFLLRYAKFYLNMYFFVTSGHSVNVRIVSESFFANIIKYVWRTWETFAKKTNPIQLAKEFVNTSHIQ